jgi:ubiquinone/menaquinone biosynthesis C-methylase UbiE
MKKTDKKPLDIHAYYSKTRFDYRYVWNARNLHGLHYGYYDENATRHEQAVPNLNRVLADLAEVKAGENVLDAGCGIGGSSIWLAKNRGAAVTGITPVESQIRDCQKNLTKSGLKNVRFLQADYRKTPFEDGTFDVVWAIESVCHSPQKADFYREAFRVLKPGGRLVMAETMRKMRPCPTPPLEQLLLDGVRHWAIPDLDTGGEHRQNAIAAGFENVEIKDVSKNVLTSVRNAYDHAVKWFGLGSFLNQIGIVSTEQVGNMIASRKMYEAMEEGLWFYALLRAEKSG